MANLATSSCLVALKQAVEYNRVVWLESFISWLRRVFNQPEPAEQVEEEQGQEVDDDESMVTMPDNISMEDAKKYIASYSIDAWMNFQGDKTVPFEELESQIAITKYAVDEGVELAPAIWRVCDQIATANGYHTPPSWALLIARTAVIEYVTGNLRLLNEKTLKEISENNEN